MNHLLSQRIAGTVIAALSVKRVNPFIWSRPMVVDTASSGGWSVVPSPLLGTNDNSLGAVAGSSPSDVWAVGNFLPDTASSNQDATLSLTDHFDGTTWTAVPSPNGGPNFNTLFGVAAMATQNVLVKLALKDMPSTAVMTTNITQLTIDLTTLIRGRGDAGELAKARSRARMTFPP